MKAKKNLSDTLKGFLKMTGHYADTATYLAEHGYTDDYMQMLAEKRVTAQKPKDKAEGDALTAQAHLFRGELGKALEWFESTEISKLPKHLDSVFVNNFILCLFLLEKPARIREIYTEYNVQALAEDTLVMRRTMGIREYTEKRYENAVTVFIKLCSQPDPRCTLMADICLVRSMLKLDMTDRAKEIADLGFDRYTAMGDITDEVNKLRLEINSASVGKSKSHKKRKNKRKK